MKNPGNIVNSIEIDSYDPEKLRSSLRHLLEPLGGIRRFVKPGMRVLIKPNLLSARTPERAVTTHPGLIEAAAAECKAIGADVLIGDSPGGIEKGLRRVWNNTGMTEAAEKSSASLVGFETSKVRNINLDGRTFHISNYAFDVDFIISLPKLKTHVLTNYTGAVKNSFGFIPGLRKSDYHKRYPDARSFSEIVVEIHSLVRPGLFIMDAGLVMEGEGPASGDPRWLGYLFAATDAVAMDSAAVSILGRKKIRVWTTELASEKMLGTADLDSLDLLGPAFSNGRIDDFKFPSNAYLNFIPLFLLKGLEPYLWVRPAVNRQSCTLCGVCVDSCPQNVISRVGDILSFDYDECIKCMCCHELCPHNAIFLERSRLAGMIGR